MRKIKLIGLFSGPLACFLVMFLDFAPDNPESMRMAGIAAWMAIYWMTEALPLSITALLPLILMPLFGIMSTSQAAQSYGSSTIFLFLGGFLIASSMEKWQLHKRISLRIIKLIGSGSSRLILGFMTASFFMSMFISNIATTIMMLPIGLAVIGKIESAYSESKTHVLAVVLLLGIAYASSIGGVATLVGTAPNLVFHHHYSISFPDAEPISFGNWLLFSLPISLTMLIVSWFLMTKVIYRLPKNLTIDNEIVNSELKQLGYMNREEKRVLTVFAITGFLWIFRRKIELGFAEIPGWGSLLPFGDMIDDGTVAIFMSLMLFFVPGGEKPGQRLLGPNAILKIPWDIIILFGGGFALAAGFKDSGLSVVIGQSFTGLAGLPVILIIAVICLSLTFMTELNSNTATSQIILPILAAISVSIGVHPLILMIPATMSASYAFMLPIATPPNAVVFGSKRIAVGEMLRAGIVLNLTGVIIITLMFYFVGTVILGI